MTVPTSDFVITIEFEVDDVVVSLEGAATAEYASRLDGVLSSLLRTTAASLVLDLASVSTIDPSGLAAVEDIAMRLVRSGETLTVRNASDRTRQAMDAAGVSAHVRFASDVPGGWAGRHGRVAPGGPAADSSTADVADELRSIALASGTDVVDAALRLVTALAKRTVQNADGVSVTLERHGRLMTVAASDDQILEMDRHQYSTGEGPCLAARTEGREFYIPSLDEESRWPHFVPLALEQGIHSILASPLMTDDRPQGSLNIYSNSQRAFGTSEQELAALFASQASEILTTAGTQVNEEVVTRRWEDALAARQTIVLAQGAVMAREQVNAAAAAAILRQAARAAQRTVLQHAALIVDAFGRAPDLGS
ncbi:MAG: GAF domain-containing protein [Ilumatobacteraceae bacterium]